jgi:hypothetical protein
MFVGSSILTRACAPLAPAAPEGCGALWDGQQLKRREFAQLAPPHVA